MKVWWNSRALHDRLSLLVTGAVAAAVLLVSAGAWVLVAQIQQRRIDAGLLADARTIAENPWQWLDSQGVRPSPGGREIGPCWQILDPSGKVVGGSATRLPVSASAVTIATTGHSEVQEEITLGPGEYLMLTVPIDGGGAVQVGVDPNPDKRVLALFAALLAAGCAVGIAGAAVLGRTVARAGLAPVDKVTEAVEDVAVTMDLTRPIEVNGEDEIARLGRSVNAMLTAIDASRRAQRALVEDAGHELRTPLTSIRTNVELLLQIERQPELAHRLPPEEKVKLLYDLDAQVRELATLTTELVELSREETSRETIEQVDLAEVVTAALDRVRIRVPGIVFDTYLEPATVLGRPGELERMAVNVLDNAAKWSPPGGTVVTRLRDGVLTVADNGPGIAEEDLPHVFNRFYRAAEARAMPGSGLGLAIVAQTAAQHGGTVKAGPNDPRGTIMTISLSPVYATR